MRNQRIISREYSDEYEEEEEEEEKEKEVSEDVKKEKPKEEPSRTLTAEVIFIFRFHRQEARDLQTVRVIQKNLVYVIGIPNDAADEAILRRSDMFGQYGNLSKSTLYCDWILFWNDTDSIYIW